MLAQYLLMYFIEYRVMESNDSFLWRNFVELFL
jgi:hypothetical protein